jgi:AraC-like DNA-binding protein
VVLLLAIELFFSWGARSGYNNTSGVLPYWMLLNYLIVPPSIYLFVKYNTDDNFKLKPWHTLFFLPALIAFILEGWAKMASVSLIEYSAWIWFSQYLPLLGLILVLGFFWIKYWQHIRMLSFKSQKKGVLTQLRFIMLMLCLTIVSLLWLLFEFVGFKNFELIEFTLIFLFLSLAFFNFMENKTFPPMAMEVKQQKFPNYNDQENLSLLENTMAGHRSYLKPNFPLKELARELNLPPRYVSFLINHYHKKNYKEYINQYRIDMFLEKVRAGENETKTLLGLALESGFSSKSTFNQVFKSHMGKSPMEYLSQGHPKP